LSENSVCKIFSKRNRDITKEEDNVHQSIIKSKKSSVKSFIVDGELVAIDKKDGKFLPYAIMQTRRKQDPENLSFTTAVVLFDIMYLNGEVLCTALLFTLSSLVYKSLSENEYKFCMIHSLRSMAEFISQRE
jgi:DNA ligase-1